MNESWRKRCAAAALALLLSAGSGLAGAASFKDVPAGAWYADTLQWAVERSIVSGYGDGTFRPDSQPTEAEFLAMLFRAAGVGDMRAAKAGEPWHAPYYERARELGYPVTQRPDAPIRRGHAARLIAASFGKTLGENEGIAFVLASSISNGRTSATVAGYDANGFMSRAEAIVFVQRTDAHRAKLDEERKNAEEAKGRKPAGQGAVAGVLGGAGSGSPDTGHAGNGNPDTGNPGSGNPGGGGDPGGGNPGGGNPGTGNPDSGNPGSGNPGDGNPDHGNGSPGNGNGNPGNGSPDGGGERPGPVRSNENEQVLTALLEQQLGSLGLARAETAQGVAVSHPEREGGGAVLAKTEDNLGYVQVFDDANGAVLDAAHALLVYAGVAIDKRAYDDMIDRVSRSGSNGAIKIGGQLITFVRGATPGQLTIHYTLMQ